MRASSLWACVLVSLLSLSVAACVSGPATFKTPLPGSYDASRGREISTGACGFQLLLVIPIAINSRFERAYHALNRLAGDNVLTNVRLQEKWTYAFIGTVYCTNLEATADPKR